MFLDTEKLLKNKSGSKRKQDPCLLAQILKQPKDNL